VSLIWFNTGCQQSLDDDTAGWTYTFGTAWIFTLIGLICMVNIFIGNIVVKPANEGLLDANLLN
jgi:hypothetical protein